MILKERKCRSHSQNRISIPHSTLDERPMDTVTSADGRFSSADRPGDLLRNFRISHFSPHSHASGGETDLESAEHLEGRDKRGGRWACLDFGGGRRHLAGREGLSPRRWPSRENPKPRGWVREIEICDVVTVKTISPKGHDAHVLCRCLVDERTPSRLYTVSSFCRAALGMGLIRYTNPKPLTNTGEPSRRLACESRNCDAIAGNSW